MCNGSHFYPPRGILTPNGRNRSDLRGDFSKIFDAPTYSLLIIFDNLRRTHRGRVRILADVAQRAALP